MNPRKELGPKLASLQRELETGQVRKYWQCLEELADSEAFQRLMQQEFPALADIWPDSLSRRKFLGLMGASLALAGVGGCSVRPAPEGTIVPYVRPPEEIVPGTPMFYATTMLHDGDAVGLLVESHEGRPTKIEGNPDHPASLGATNIFHQTSVLTLYDPARSQTVVSGDQIRGWNDVEAAISKATSRQADRRGRGMRLLTESVRSPTLTAQIQQFLRRFPEAKWHQFEPINDINRHQAAQTAFGRVVDVVYDFTQADVVVALDADFFTQEPGHLRYARDFMSRRRPASNKGTGASAGMNRLYVVETAVSCTGAKADHRLAVPMRDIETVARELAAKLEVGGADSPTNGNRRWIQAVANDLKTSQGRSIVLAGRRQPPAVHMLVHAMNERLANHGPTITFIDPVAAKSVDVYQSLRELTDDIDRGVVDELFILGGNPAYTAPADLDFATRLPKVRQSFHLSLYEDETSRLSTWHLPEAHYLESWGDARAFDGTVSLVQPLIAPLYEGRSKHELLAIISGDTTISGLEIVKRQWSDKAAQNGRDNDFESKWQRTLHDGVMAGTRAAAVSVTLKSDVTSKMSQGLQAVNTNGEASLELVFQADPSIYDGRYANNGWLQELPKPMTKLTWGNAAIMSPRNADTLGVKPGAFAHGGEHGGYEMPLVSLQLGERTMQVPAWIMPGHADDSVTIYLGHGRESASRAHGEWQQTLGSNAYPLRTTEHPWFASGLNVAVLDASFPVACTQAHHLMDDRDVIRSITWDEFKTNPQHAIEHVEEKLHEKLERSELPLTLYEDYDYAPPQRKWGMSLNTTTCMGCNACIVACQAENNIPVVGKEQVLFGREMHWLRVDRYLHGSLEEPDEFYFQPVPCMHCEHAPCEYVCPVAATVHSAEGLNDMIYNRCVGTRFCSNNCPYKVRRFNFLAYANFETVPLRLQYNPDVTVRSRGVMEKCSYCVQRIRLAEATAEAAGRPVRDGEVLTACQAACPSQAIVFGDVNDPASAVRECKDSPLDYGLLAELNTRPRTTYLAALRNPNPELEAQDD